MADDREPIEPVAIEWAYLDPDVEALEPPTAAQRQAAAQRKAAAQRQSAEEQFEHGETTTDELRDREDRLFEANMEDLYRQDSQDTYNREEYARSYYGLSSGR